MLHASKSLENLTLRARDGDIGKIRDLYFDDQHWHIRYLIVDTGRWLADRRVLISPESVTSTGGPEEVVSVDLTQEQVRRSPGIDTAKPVSRTHEMELRHHYGWPPYWGVIFPEAAMAPGGPVPLDAPAPRAERPPSSLGASTPTAAATDDPHLRSTGEVIGYHVEAVDGQIGHVDDFLIDDDAWRIRYLVIDTRNWWAGKKVIVAPGWIRAVSWPESKVSVDLTRDSIKGSPPYDPARPMTHEESGELHDYYGRARYPDWDPTYKSAESRRNFRA